MFWPRLRGVFPRLVAASWPRGVACLHRIRTFGREPSGIHRARQGAKGVPGSLVKSIAKQMLLGLQYLQDECDLAHKEIKMFLYILSEVSVVNLVNPSFASLRTLPS